MKKLRLAIWPSSPKPPQPPIRITVVLADGRQVHYELRTRPLPPETGQAQKW